jgi:hypothetical protein
METEIKKNKRGRVIIGGLTGLAIGAVGGFIGGIRTRDIASLWLIIGIVVGIILGIALSRLFSSRKKSS